MQEIEIRKLKAVIFKVRQNNKNPEEIIGFTKDGDLCRLPSYAKEEIGLKPGDLGRGFLKSVTGKTRLGKDIMILFNISEVEKEKI